MTKVYAIMCGDIDDYGIKAIYSTREKAEDHNRYYAGTIEEMELDPEPDVEQPGMFLFAITMQSDGEYRWSYRDVSQFSWIRERGFLGDRYDDSATFHVLAHDLETAVKAANEKRLYLIEQKIWGTDCEAWHGIAPVPDSPNIFKITREMLMTDGFSIVAGSQIPQDS